MALLCTAARAKTEICSGVVVGTSAWHAVGQGSIPAWTRHVLSAVKMLLSTSETVYLLWSVVAQWLKRHFETWASLFTPHCPCLSDETL